MKKAVVLLTLVITSIAGAQTSAEYEARQTAKYLGIEVKPFPQLTGYDDIPTSAAEFRFRVQRRPLTGPTPTPSYQERDLVSAKGAAGIVYEAYAGTYDEKKVWPGPGRDSSNMNTRQLYAPHLGYGYIGPDIFIGTRDRGRIRTMLFFRDFGSHATAPHFIAVDSRNHVHLIVADVNISDNNELNIYSLIGDPESGKWMDAVMLDRRGFTSWSSPWAGAWRDKVFLLWNWGDATYDKNNVNMGLFFVEWGPSGYGRKVRPVKGLIETYDVAIDPVTGLLVVVASRDDGVFVVSRSAQGRWTKAAKLDPALNKRADVSISPASNGLFIIRTDHGRSEYVLRTI
jgi:hypothetical protein